MQTTILLVEDDAVLRRGLAELFAREGYRVIEAASVREAKDKLNSEVQAVVLDVGLPDGDGVTLCRAWREAGEQRPILFLTAKDEELDVVRALDSGGNDYVTKPFRMQELLSRVRVLLRSAKPQTVQRDSFTVEESKMQIAKDGAPLPLTLTEYKIVKMLMERRGVVPRNLPLHGFRKVADHVVEHVVLRNRGCIRGFDAGEQLLQMFLEKSHEYIPAFTRQNPGQVFHMILQVIEDMLQSGPEIVIVGKIMGSFFIQIF